MNKDAIKQIQESAHIPDLIKQLTEAGTQVPAIVVPDSYNIEVIERLMPNASRYRLEFGTSSIKDFIFYNEEFDQLGATCFVNADSMTAKTIFDLGTVEEPGHQENTARLKLKRTVALAAVVGIAGRPLKQKDAAEFIEDWADHIVVANSDGESMTAHQSAKRLMDLTIEAAREVNSKVHDFGESASAMERIEAKNQDSLPAEMAFTCTPYNGLEERQFSLRVGILTGGEKPAVVFRIMRLEQIEEEIAEEFKDLLNDSFQALELKTFIGEA
jgi:uncharacterized protein YfdQ (DUF2303 family)